MIVHDLYMYYYNKNTISSFPTILTRLILVITFAASVHISELEILTRNASLISNGARARRRNDTEYTSLFCIHEPRSHKLRCAHKIPWAASENERQDEL